jgi:hypothetical protein
VACSQWLVIEFSETIKKGGIRDFELAEQVDQRNQNGGA